MKIFAKILCLAAAITTPLFAQTDACSQNSALSGGTTLTVNSSTEQRIGTVSNTDYEYELWHNKSECNVANTMTVRGANQGGGAAFRAEWNQNNSCDFLARIGYKFEKSGSGSGKLYKDYGNIYADYNYTRSGVQTAGIYSYIGIYGWARASSNSKLVEFYIVDDWWGNQYQGDGTLMGTSTTGGSVIGSVSIDGATYNIIKNSRSNQPSIEGNKDFDQYFSVRQGGGRKCGRISITEHFKAWEAAGLRMGTLYEAKLLAEAGGGKGWIDYTYASMTMSNTALSSSGTVASSSSRASSSSNATVSSSSSRPAQATTCGNYIGTLPANPNPPANPYTACFLHANNKCYVCKVDNEGDGNTCRSTWVWDGSNVAGNLDKGYWYKEVNCPAGAVQSSSSVKSSSSSLISSSSLVLSSSSISSSSSAVSNSSSSSAATIPPEPPVQATTCSNFIGTLPANPHPSDPYTACFLHTDDNCYVCKVSSEGDGNTCASNWVWTGNYVGTNLSQNLWYSLVDCPAGLSSSSSDGVSSSSSAHVQATSCTTSDFVWYPVTPPPASPYTACFKYTNDKCYVCKVESENEDNTCSSIWVWNGSEIADNLANGSWYHEVVCPEIPSRMLSSTPSAAFNVRAMSNGALLVESNANAAIYLYDIKGNLAQKIQVPAGSSVVQTSVAAGLYVVKNLKTKQIQKVVVK